ncbi:TRAP transporter small permease [Microbaculum marinum]|uniref:TRAP transporter small permease protein n=1 Tax=Microbaculum marinum TaxID=1764581 RepID=A0AAW9S3E4_9HYPH
MNAFERLINRIVLLVDAAAAMFLGVITALTFITVVLRYVFNASLPGSFDVGRLLLGVAIFWGIAVAAYRKEHIQVDILWSALPRRAQGALNVFADLVFFGCACVFTAMFWLRVMATRTAGETTFELDVPIWPFHFAAWLGIAFTAVVLAARILHVVVLRRFDSPDEGPPGQDSIADPLGLPTREP